MKSIIKKTSVMIIAVIILLTFSLTVSASGYYIHDPMENPKAAADIVVDPNAVYGYAPNPDSPRLGAYAQYDWSDEAFVEEMRQQRIAYHESLQELYQIKADMEAEGKSVEEIARAVCIRRNELRFEAYEDDPEGLAALIESNLETYGNEFGGTPEYFYEKYGSWEMVIEKAFSTNAGADAILGLYDEYYYTYIIDTPQSSGGDGEGEGDGDTPPDVTEPDEDTEEDSGSSMKSPETGYDPSVMLWSSLVMMGVIGIAAAAVKLKGAKGAVK